MSEQTGQTRLIFVGERFYWESGTVMSPIYSEAGNRYDWGLVCRDLESGKTVTIRPATPREIQIFETELAGRMKQP